ncbi:MAG: hypothetical protein ACE5F6_16985 [Anaerolineae bacterium]
MQRMSLVQPALWLALTLALVGSLRHVAWAFATLEGGDLTAGYIQAVAVDVGLAALAYAIHHRRRERRPSRVLWLGVVVFSGISAYANLLHGLYFAADLGLSTWGMARPFMLSGVLPVLVVYLSEIVSSDVQHAVKVAERERKKAERRQRRETPISEAGAGFPYPIEQARTLREEQRELSKAEAMDRMLDIWRERPDIGMTELAGLVGRSRTTCYAYLDELVGSGRAVKTEDGVRVVDGNGHRTEPIAVGVNA